MKKTLIALFTAVFIVLMPSLPVYASPAQPNAGGGETLTIPADKNWIGWDWNKYYKNNTDSKDEKAAYPDFNETSGLASFTVKIPAPSLKIIAKESNTSSSGSSSNNNSGAADNNAKQATYQVKFTFDVDYYSIENGKLIVSFKDVVSDSILLAPQHKHGSKVIGTVFTGTQNIKLKLYGKYNVTMNVYLYENNLYLCQSFICTLKSYPDRRTFESKELSIPASASPILKESASNLWMYKVTVKKCEAFISE